ncbi:MAG: CPBP family glutamic-type intramembrane protease [Verrucomicrobiales bacterium]|nr:type II CAAX endopeptidase family protein [Verrucomicrobiota bacterium JB025]
MSDPTPIVLSFGFGLALVVFVGGVVARRVSAKRVELGDAGGSGDEVVAAGVVGPPRLPEGKVPVWAYGPLDWLGAGFVFCVFSGLVMLAAGADPQGEVVISAGVLAANIGFQFMIAGVVCALVLWRVNVVDWLGLRWREWPWLFLIAPGAVGVMWAVFYVLHFTGYMKLMESFGVETVQETVQLLQQSEDPVVLGLMAFAAVVAAPICEEVVFRGYLYPVLKRYGGMWPAAIATALVFGAAHGSMTALLPLVIFGGLLVYLYERTGSLWAPMAVHFCFNGATVVVQILARVFDIPLEPPT